MSQQKICPGRKCGVQWQCLNRTAPSERQSSPSDGNIVLSNGIVCDSNRQKGVLFTREMLRRDILSTPATCIVDYFLEVPPSYPSASRTALRSDKKPVS